MEKSELTEALKKDEALCLKLKDMWKNNTDAKEIAEALTSAGLPADTNTVEALLSDLQKKRMEKIVKKELDEQQLFQISGGKNGGMKCSNTDDCDWKFLDGIDLVSLNERCYVFQVCDEFMNL